MMDRADIYVHKHRHRKDSVREADSAGAISRGRVVTEIQKPLPGHKEPHFVTSTVAGPRTAMACYPKPAIQFSGYQNLPAIKELLCLCENVKEITILYLTWSNNCIKIHIERMVIGKFSVLR